MGLRWYDVHRNYVNITLMNPRLLACQIDAIFSFKGTREWFADPILTIVKDINFELSGLLELHGLP